MQPLGITWQSRNDVALLGLLRSVNVKVRPTTGGLKEQLKEGMRSCPLNLAVRDAAIRAMLRKGGFKPSGRNRPAQEYLSKVAATPTGLLSICNVVDINNYLSLRHQLPASIIDTASVEYDDLLVREGSPGETYVFNSSGQELRLNGLLCLATIRGGAVASPVKDAIDAHVTEKTTSVIVCVYGSLDLLSQDEMADLIEEYASLLVEHAQARTTDMIIVSASSRDVRRRP